MSYYRTCPDCSSSLDPGERCDCQDKEKAAPVLEHQSGKVKVIDQTTITVILHNNREDCQE